MGIFKYFRRIRHQLLSGEYNIEQIKRILNEPSEPHMHLAGYVGKNIGEILKAFPNGKVRLSRQESSLYLEVEVEEAEGIKCLVFENVICTDALFFPNI